MSDYKDFYIETLENLIEDYLESHPDATWDDAYELLADKAYDVATDKLADRADYYKDMERGL